MNPRLVPIAIGLSLLLPLAGCGGTSSSDTGRGASVPTSTTVSPQDEVRVLQQAFESGGLKVTASAPTTTSAFVSPAQVLTLRVGGSTVQIFRYPTVAEASAAASQVGADGSSLGKTQIDWRSPPHFFKHGRLIAVFLTAHLSTETTFEAQVLGVLRQQMGPQFAGVR